MILESEVVQKCWASIGTFGDGSCSELQALIHCRNCPVYAEGGRRLLDREPPQGYVLEWTSVLAREKETLEPGLVSVMIFRVGAEWFAFKADILQKVATLRSIHHIPHRTNRILLGLVNIDGQLLLCGSLAGLLDVEAAEASDGAVRPGQMIVASRDRAETWVLPVDEIYGFDRVDPDGLAPTPVTVGKAAASYSRGLFAAEGRAVSFIEEQKLFDALKRSLTS